MEVIVCNVSGLVIFFKFLNKSARIYILASCDNSDCPLLHFDNFSAIYGISPKYYSI
jgi:hypothetical protein